MRLRHNQQQAEARRLKAEMINIGNRLNEQTHHIDQFNREIQAANGNKQVQEKTPPQDVFVSHGSSLSYLEIRTKFKRESTKTRSSRTKFG